MGINNKIEISRLIANDTSFNELKNIKCYKYFSFLYDTYAAKVLGFIIAHNYSKADGEKVLEKVFITVWENIKTYEDGEKKQLYRILAIAAKIIYKHKQITYFLKTQNMPNHTPKV